MKDCVPMGLGIASLLCCGTALSQTYDGTGSPDFVPHTIQEALASAYLTNPKLQEERAKLRGVDEQVPQALSGWRPTIQGQFGGSYYKGFSKYGAQSLSPGSSYGTPAYSRRYSTPGYVAGVTLSQPIYSGGKTTAATHQAVNTVRAERATLIQTEQEVFGNVVDAYLGVVREEQILQITVNNQRLLKEQVRATETRFRQGEITRTDVAQAEAALATAEANRQQVEGSLKAAQATYLQVVGVPAAPNLVAPEPLKLPISNEHQAVSLAVENNPQVIQALFTEAAGKDAMSVAIAALMPQVSATLAYQRLKNQGYGQMLTNNKYAMLNLQVPIYQGGEEYSKVRQARQQMYAAHRDVDVQRRSAAQLASSNWERLKAYRESIASNRAAIYANVVALDGIERQALVGTSSTFAVLQQQQTLLQAQTALIQSLSGLVQASYAVAAAMGRLTAADLKLNVPLYDEKAYYNTVKNKLWGISNYATNQPGL